ALRMNRPTPSRRGRALRRMLAEAREGLLSRSNGPGVLVSSVVVLAGHIAMFVLAARVTGTDAAVSRLLPLAVLALLAMSLPLNVGGWGPREGVAAWAFGAAGLGAGRGLSVAVVYGVLSLVASLPGVVVLVGRWYGRVRRGGREASFAPAAPSRPNPGGFAPGPPVGLRPRPQTPDGLGVAARAGSQGPDGPGVAARAGSQGPDGPGVAARVSSQASDVRSEKYAPKESVRLARS